MVYNVRTQVGRYNKHARNIVATRCECSVSLVRTIEEIFPLSWEPNPAPLPSRSSTQLVAMPWLDVSNISIRGSASFLPLCHSGSRCPKCYYFPLNSVLSGVMWARQRGSLRGPYFHAVRQKVRPSFPIPLARLQGFSEQFRDTFRFTL